MSKNKPTEKGGRNYLGKTEGREHGGRCPAYQTRSRLLGGRVIGGALSSSYRQIAHIENGRGQHSAYHIKRMPVC